MITFNKSASGQKIRSNFNQDISSASAFTMTLQPEEGGGNKQELIPTLGTVDVDVGDEKFLANQYVEYTTTSEQFTFAGRWRQKATATLASSVVAAKYIFFRVIE